MRTVAALCVHRNGVYGRLPCVDVWDQERDASNYDGSDPVVAHPMCRGWSESYSTVAHVQPGERELGLYCCEVLKCNGGVLEQPARSRLFQAGGLPPAGERWGNLETIEVLQSWWGFRTRKRTWLCFSGVDVRSLVIPFRMQAVAREGLVFERLSKRQRSETVPALAAWLVDAARGSQIRSHSESVGGSGRRNTIGGYSLTATMS